MSSLSFPFSAPPPPCVLALGNFDGVHLGHAAVLAATVKEARRRKIPACALTFEPHPYAVFAGEKEPFLLTTLEEKNRLLHQGGADDVFVCPFTPAMAAQTPEAFIDEVLIKTCRAAHVVVGFDFVFGRGRGGDGAALRAGLLRHGVEATLVPPARGADGEVFSSTRVRAAIRRGDMAVATALLGRPFSLSGFVIEGDRRGRALAVPTANIVPDERKLKPPRGVYAVRVGEQGGVANFGVRPTFGGVREILEVHLFDMTEDFYGQEWSVELLSFLRPEKAFATPQALAEQINCDCAQAQALLKEKRTC